jgi:hypothetical protein
MKPSSFLFCLSTSLHIRPSLFIIHNYAFWYNPVVVK